MTFDLFAYMEAPFELLDNEATGTFGQTTDYAASHPYISHSTDTPPSTYFDGRLDVPLRFERTILSGQFIAQQATLGFGDVELNNEDGHYDDVAIAGSIDGRRVTIKVGSPEFDYAKFGIIFDGTARGWELTETRLRLLVRDLGFKLEIPIQKTLYGGTGGLDGGASIASVVKPILMGRCFNMTPVTVDAANLIYQINDGALRSVEAVYDRGAELTPGSGYTVDLARGLITLLASPAGQITVDATGDVLTPAAILASGTSGCWLDPSDFSTMFQLSDQTSPVTAVGQPVGFIRDKSGSGNHFHQPTSGSRPLLQVDGGGSYYLDFDGTDDFMTAVTEGAFAFSNGVTLAAAVQLDDWTVGTASGVFTKTENGGWGIGVNDPSYGFGFGSVVYVGATPDAVAASAYFAIAAGPHVLSSTFDLRRLKFRIDSAQQALTDYGSKTTITYSTPSNATLGAEAGTDETPTGGFLDGRIYGVVALARACSTAEMDILDAYLLDQCGVQSRPVICSADVVRHAVMLYGAIPDTEIDTASFTRFASQSPAEIGIYIKSPDTLDKSLQKIVAGCGGWTGYNRAGKLQAAVFGAPVGLPRFEFGGVEIIEIEKLALPSSINPPNWRRRLGYKKNWTIQGSDVAGSVTIDRRIFLATDSSMVKSQDANIRNRHLLATDPDPNTSLFTEEDDAQTEADRLMALYGVARSLYRVVLKTQPFVLDIGSVIRLTYPRWDLHQGKKFVVARVSEDAKVNRVEITVFG